MRSDNTAETEAYAVQVTGQQGRKSTPCLLCDTAQMLFPKKKDTAQMLDTRLRDLIS